MILKSTVADREILARQISKMTGLKYKMVSGWDCKIGVYIIDTKGNLIVDLDEADPGVLLVLLQEGLIEEPEEDPVEEPEVEPRVEPEAELEVEPLAEPVAPPVEEAPPTVVVLRPGPEIPEEQEPVVDQEDSPDPEPAEQELMEPLIEEAQPIAEDLPTNEAQPIEEFSCPVRDEYIFPLQDHTGLSLRNLIKLIYSREQLINIATGSNFHVDETLLQALKNDFCTYTVNNFRQTLKAYEELHGCGLFGLEIGQDSLAFTGFDPDASEEKKAAFAQLAFAMNRFAIKQRSIQTKVRDCENEKYEFHLFLVRLKMGGDEYKETRKQLMRNLSGIMAYRTQEEADRAHAKLNQKRMADKAAALERQAS